jgi:hypothetical protein
MIGLAAVVLSLGIPMAAMYTFFRVKKLKDRRAHGRYRSRRLSSF